MDSLLHLPLHYIDFINIDGFFVPVQGNDYAQANSSLGRWNVNGGKRL
jgi:hypothetical protein